jgi:L-amino acid N-acyltransferase YncA
MANESWDVRDATAADAPACAAVYAPYVLSTAVSLELDPPDGAEMARRIAAAQRRHAWLVLTDSSEVVGYAYAGGWRSRPAYRLTCEVSVYVQRNRCGRGGGRLLYERLLDRMAELGYRTAVAVMTEPNPGSTALHRSVGFDHVGTLPAVGLKHDAWHDVSLWTLDLEGRLDRA